MFFPSISRYTAKSGMALVAMAVPIALSAPQSLPVSAAGHFISVGPNTDISLFSSFMPIKTSTGVSVDLSMAVISTGSPTAQPQLQLALSNAACGVGVECPPEQLHAWVFPLTANTFAYNVGKGTAEFSSQAQLDPFGDVFMSFTGTSSTAVKCDSGSEVQQSGTINGTIYFSTGGASTTAWGTVGKSTKALSFASKGAVVTYDNDCRTTAPKSRPAPCVSGVYWYSPFGVKSGVSFEGILDSGRPWGTRASIANASRQVYLKTPANSYRVDQTFDFTPIAKDYPSLQEVAIKSGGKLSHKLIHGSAFLILAGKSTESTGTCRSGKTLKRAYYRQFASARWADGAQPLTAVSSIGGNMSVGEVKVSGEATIYSYK